MVKTLAAAALALAVVLALIGLALPREVHVERSIAIDAPRETVFDLVNGFASFKDWSPWYELDPYATYTLEGPTSGVGAAIRWQGDPDAVGSGRMRIVESRPRESVTTEVVFGPQRHAITRLTLTANGGATTVTWALDADTGSNPFARYAGLLFTWFIGRDLENGLARLKKVSEGQQPSS